MSGEIQKNIVILISGGGSNMAALVDASRRQHWARRFGAQVVAVISNKAEAGGLAWAREHGLATDVVDHKAHASREAFDAQLMQAIDYEGRLVNIHPSLLPAFPGLKTHERAIEMGCRFAGATVHRVTAELDHGAILEQAVVPVLPDDTPEALAARVLTQEHVIYPRAVERLLAQMD